MDLKVMSELCADSRTVPTVSGMHLNVDGKPGLGGAEPLEELADLQRMPAIALLIYPADAAGSPLTTRFRDRLPLEALDKTGYTPAEGGVPDVATLNELSDKVGHLVQVPKAGLQPPAPEQVPDQHDRLLPLDADGLTTTWDDAAWLRMPPPESPTVNAWSDLPEELVRTMALALDEQPYLPGRIVFGPDTAELGLPSGLVDVWHDDLVSRFGRPLNNDDIATARAGGASPPQVLPGYVELLRIMEQSPANTQALVKVDDAAAEPHVFLASHDGFNVSFLDLGPGPAGARFPKEHGPVEVTTLPGTMPLDSRVDSLIGAGQPQPAELVRPLLPQPEVTYYKPEGGTDLPILVVGPRGEVPTAYLDSLAGHVQKVGQPIVVLSGIGRNGAVPENRIEAIRTLLPQLEVHGQVPVVVSRAGLKAGDAGVGKLHAALDKAGASLAHPIPSGLGSVWAVRVAKSDTTTGGAPDKRVFDEFGLPLLQFAVGENRKPKQTPPPTPVANYLTTPLKQQIGTKDLQNLFGSEAKKLAPLVEQIATREPIFAGHGAAMRLAGKGQAGTVTDYANDPANGHRALFKPMLEVPGGTAAERGQGVQTLLEDLAILSGAYGMTDIASHGVLLALNAKLTGKANDAEVRDMIWSRKDHLPEGKRPEFARLISDLKQIVPDDDAASYDQVAEWILTCPPPEGEPPVGS